MRRADPHPFVQTELCRSWEEKGNWCAFRELIISDPELTPRRFRSRYGTKCQFAHGKQEVREVPRHPKVRLTFRV